MNSAQLACVISIICVIIIMYLMYRGRCDNKTLLLMTQFWAQHLFYTRLVAEAYLKGSPNLPQLSARLKRNQTDIGALVGARYGPNAGQKISDLLTEHVDDAMLALADVKAGRDTAASTAALYANADQIGMYLDGLKGTNGVFRHHMKTHIDTLLGSISAYAAGQYDNDIRHTDAYLNAGIEMAFDMILM